jgi:hypothetical protein
MSLLPRTTLNSDSEQWTTCKLSPYLQELSLLQPTEEDGTKIARSLFLDADQ